MGKIIKQFSQYKMYDLNVAADWRACSGKLILISLFTAQNFSNNGPWHKLSRSVCNNSVFYILSYIKLKALNFNGRDLMKFGTSNQWFNTSAEYWFWSLQVLMSTWSDQVTSLFILLQDINLEMMQSHYQNFSTVDLITNNLLQQFFHLYI